jgi:hypothetical protein
MPVVATLSAGSDLKPEFVGVCPAVDPPLPGTAAHRGWESLGSIAAGAGQVRTLEFWRILEPQLLMLARQVEHAARLLAGIAVRLAGELAARGTAGTLGAKSPASLLQQSLNISMGQARGRIRVAKAALPSETPTGQTIEPVLPELLGGLDTGAFSEDHAVVIADTIAALPSDLDVGLRGMATDLLTSQACLGDPTRLRRVGEQLRQTLDPDGTLEERDLVDRQELHIGTRRRDGMTPIRGLLDPLTSEALRQAIEPLAEPRPVDASTPDRRSAPVRRAQALGEVMHRYLVSGRGPVNGGVRPQVVVTIPLDDLLSRLGSAWADGTGPISAAKARLLACDAEIIPQILGSDSVVLDQGRAARLFPPEVRRAIATRDRGCAFPGCDTPPAWCDCHHILWWGRDLGPTSERNGCLLCRRHHTLIHQGDWEIQVADHGRPEFIPPPFIDPSRTPRTNTYRMLPTVAAGPTDRAGRRACRPS